ncbi:MAG: nitronate monooxygenase [Deltaproteobacteria bacterium]|nr:nitronate monooxygenase [Deltaproteobacteria bacterium]
MRTRVTEMLKIRYPIALGGMAGVTDAKLAAAVSEAGGLGTIAAAKESAASLKEEISRLKKITDRPFAVNVPLMLTSASDLMNVIVNQKVPVVITAAGNPVLFTKTLKENGIIVIHVVSCVDLAKKAEDAGVDAVIAEGFESGGFASPYEIGTLALVPQVVDAVKIPVIAAGGIADARGFAACLILGAEGVSVGTAFLMTEECVRIGKAWRDLILGGSDTSTKIVARGLAPVRLLVNSSSEELDRMVAGGASRKEVLNYIFSADWMGDQDGPFPCGQALGLIKKVRTVRELMDDFVLESGNFIKKMAVEISKR